MSIRVQPEHFSLRVQALIKIALQAKSTFQKVPPRKLIMTGHPLEFCRHFKKISLQCILGVLCLVSFLSVGMLFSNINIWELNCFKYEGRQVITILREKCLAEYCLLYLHL